MFSLSSLKTLSRNLCQLHSRGKDIRWQCPGWAPNGRARSAWQLLPRACPRSGQCAFSAWTNLLSFPASEGGGNHPCCQACRGGWQWNQVHSFTHDAQTCQSSHEETRVLNATWYTGISLRPAPMCSTRLWHSTWYRRNFHYMSASVNVYEGAKQTASD